MYIKLQDKLNYVKEAFEMPYHFYTIAQNGSDRIIIFEDKKGDIRKFRGKSMYGAVDNAEQYARQEIEKGLLNDPEADEDSSDEGESDDEENNKEENNEDK